MGIKKALEILEPFQKNLEDRSTKLRNIFDDSKIQNLEDESSGSSNELDHQSQILKKAIKELKNKSTSKKTRKSPLTLRGY